MSAPPLLDVQGISVDLVRRGVSEPILRDVSFELRERQVLGIIGESGSGKTVLSRVLCNAITEPLKITAGSVGYHGRDLLTIPAAEMQALRGRESAISAPTPAARSTQRFPSAIRSWKSCARSNRICPGGMRANGRWRC